MFVPAQGASAPTVFHFNASSIRVLELDGMAWFVASDVAQALSYRNAADLVRMLDHDEKDTHPVRTLGGAQKKLIINESGLYHAVIKSRKTEAVAFRKWVTGTVLPAIRKTGRYEPNSQPAPVPALPTRRIRSRDDLSFTARDAQGHLINWCVPSRAGSWHEHVSLGQAWFREIIQLAQHSPEEAYQALLYAGCSEVLLKHWDHGHEHGFMDLFARFAVAAMITRDGDLPELPFPVRDMGAARVLGQGREAAHGR